MTGRVVLGWALGLFLVLALMGRARADETEGKPAPATFALIIGANQSVDANLGVLRYADDDAARYLDLFRLLGARTYLLTRLDENTRRIHPQAVAEAMEPRKTSFDVAAAQLVADVQRASERGVETVVYFVYAGHGNVANGEGYVTLEDARITGGDLARLFARVPATRIHVIADACGSYFLAYSRGPGGERRPISLGIAPALSSDPRVGLLLSTSSARESHEWDAFQSGVFSHEVRSGLYGAADANGDGLVSYREIAAFVARANASVPNERYRPELHARAPAGGDLLLDVRRARGRRVEIDGKHAGHYYLEDSRGVRIADLHNAPGQSLSLVRPPPTGRTYLRRVDDDIEFVLDASSSPEDAVSIASLTAEDPRTAARGAAHESFEALFALPFDQAAVDTTELEFGGEPAVRMEDLPERPARTLRRPIAIGAFAVGGSAIAAGAALSISGVILSGSVTDQTSQARVAEINEDVQTRNIIAAACFIGGGAAVVAGAVLFLWPSSAAATPSKGLPQVSILPGGGGTVGWAASF